MTSAADNAILFAKMAVVMESVDRIPKRGTNKFHGYQYATEADVSDAVRRELATNRVAVFVSSRLLEVRDAETSKGKPTLLTDVEVTVTFACADTGATFEITSVGTGDDPTDKGTYKAITGAVKYALMKSLLIPTGDDPEDDSSDNSGPSTRKRTRTTKATAPKLISEAQQKKLVKAAVAAGLDAKSAKERAKNIKVDEFDEKLAALVAAGEGE